MPLFVGLDGSGHILSGSVSICNPNRGGKTAQTRLSDSVTMDSLLRDLNIERCDFLKMDCEGAEYEILSSAPPTALRKIARIAIECHDNRMQEALEILKRAGFAIESQSSGETGLLKATKIQGDHLS